MQSQPYPGALLPSASHAAAACAVTALPWCLASQREPHGGGMCVHSGCRWRGSLEQGAHSVAQPGPACAAQQLAPPCAQQAHHLPQGSQHRMSAQQEHHLPQASQHRIGAQPEHHLPQASQDPAQLPTPTLQLPKQNSLPAAVSCKSVVSTCCESASICPALCTARQLAHHLHSRQSICSKPQKVCPQLPLPMLPHELKQGWYHMQPSPLASKPGSPST